jgi:hypothetical protein
MHVVHRNQEIDDIDPDFRQDIGDGMPPLWWFNQRVKAFITKL